MTQTTWTKSRDKYGRTMHSLFVAGRVVGVVVKMPAAAAARPDMGAYLSNDWTMTRPAMGMPEGAVAYHPTLAAAKARIEAIAA